MEVEVKYFGMIAEQLGRESESIAFDAKALPADLSAFFRKRYPQLEGMTFQLAVDQEMTDRLTERSTEIAVLPPFAGG